MDCNSEKYLEKYLLKAIKKLKGLCLKFVSPGNRGVPDRIIILTGPCYYWVELKTKGETLDPLQEWWKKELEALGCKHYIIDTFDKLQAFLNEIQST